jgi:hypothetical protein
LLIAVAMTKIDAAPSDHLASDGGRDHTHATTVSVGDILDRRVPLEWFESVAIVASLCSTLADRDATKAPAPRDIVLTPKGTLDLPGDTHNLVALPRLLHELLEITTPPTPLRLLVLHALDGHGSPAKFGEALAYYERPGREALIQAARQRCLEAPLTVPEAGQSVSQKLERDAQMEPPAPASPASRKQKPRRRTAAVLVTCAATAAVLVAVGYSQHSFGSFDIAAAFRAAAAHVAETGRGVAHAVATELSLGSAQADTQEASAATSEEQARPPKSVKRHRSDVVTSSPGPAPRSEEVVAQATETDEDADVTTSSAEATVALADVLPAAASDATILHERNIVGPTIPPKLVDPVRLPSWAQPAGSESLNVIELDIAETGTVKSVRMVSPTIRMTDMMILSAAKTWIFEPALEDGRPVPYRLTLNWVGPNR